MSLKKYMNDKSPFPQSTDELDGHVLSFEGHDRPRYVYPFNNESGYLGLDDWGQYWNKPVFISETSGRLDQTKYYSIIVVPLKTDISVGGLPIYGEATQPSMPRQPTVALRGISYTIPKHTQTVIKDCGLAYATESDAVTGGDKAWAVNEHVGKTVKNVETGVQTLITANTATVLTSAGASISAGDRYQILSIACNARLIYACEMASAVNVNNSDYYLIGVINNNTETTYTLKNFVESADIWDFGAGQLQPPNANCVKAVGGIMFCGGGISEVRGIAKYVGGFEARQATSTSNEEITVQVIDDVFEGGEIEKVVRLTLGSALASLTDVHEGSYISITSASKEKNIIQNVRVLRADPAGRWVEFLHNSAATNATYTVSEPIITGAGDADVSQPTQNDSAVSEYWELVCSGADSLFVPAEPAYTLVPGGTGLREGGLSTPEMNQDNNALVAETWTLTCTDVVQTFEATAPTRTGNASGNISTPEMNPVNAAAETWLLTCSATNPVFGVNTISNNAGTGGTIGNGTKAIDKMSTPRVASWRVDCTEEKNSYTKDKTAPFNKTSGGTANGQVTLLSLTSSPMLGSTNEESWEIKCTGPTTERYLISNGAANVGVNVSGLNDPNITTINLNYYARGYSATDQNSNYVDVKISDNINTSVTNYGKLNVFGGSVTIDYRGAKFTYSKQTSSSDVSGAVTVGIRASTGATFTAKNTTTNTTTGTFLSGALTDYTNNSFSIKVSDGATRWALNDAFTFKITQVPGNNAVFTATEVHSGGTVVHTGYKITSGNGTQSSKNVNNLVSIKINDGTTKWRNGNYFTFSVSSAAGPNATFKVESITGVDPDIITTRHFPDLITGNEYSNDKIAKLRVEDDSTGNYWEYGDTITFDVTATNQNGATFSVEGSVSGVKDDLTSSPDGSVEYNNQFFKTKLLDHISDKWQEGDEITFVVSETVGVGDGKIFSVTGERSGAQNDLTVNVPYSNEFFSITVEAPATSGTTAWAVGDRIYFAIVKTPTSLVDETMQFFIVPNYIQGSTGADKTYFSEGLKDALFQFPSDLGTPYRISWVDPINQRLGLGGKYTGNNNLNQYMPTEVKSSYALYYSDARNPHRIRSGSIVDIGDNITGLSSVSDNVLVFCDNSLLRVSVDSLGAAPVLISDNIRCPAPFSIVKGEKLVMFYDGTGFSITDGVTVTSVTAYKLRNYLSNLNKAYEANIRGVYDRENKRFEFVFALGTDTLNNHGVYITEDSWNCYPFTRPDCSTLWTNYDNGNLRVYHGTSGQLTDGTGTVWKHEGDADGTTTEKLTVTAISGQVITVTGTAQSALIAGDSVSVYPIASGEEVKQLVLSEIEAIGVNPYTYKITFDSLYDLTDYEAGDLLLAGYIPFDYGIKWTDFGSPQYRHQVRALHLDFEGMNGTLYIDHCLDMNTTPVVTNTYELTSADTKLVVPFRMGKCYKYGFRLRGYSSTGIKISAFEIMYDTQV